MPEELCILSKPDLIAYFVAEMPLTVVATLTSSVDHKVLAMSVALLPYNTCRYIGYGECGYAHMCKTKATE